MSQISDELCGEVLWKYGVITIECAHANGQVVVTDGFNTSWITDHGNGRWSSESELRHMENVCNFLDWWFTSGRLK